MTQSHSFTLKSNIGIQKVLHMPVYITRVYEHFSKCFKTTAIWDTGASGTVITQKVVEHFNLKPTGIAKVNTASESGIITNTYLIDLYLKEDLMIQGVKVTVGKISDNIDCLIGMDVITLSDFSFSNFNGKTCLSIRFPSQHEIDYVKDPQFTASTPPIVQPTKIQRNDPCPCGSSKKYKHCCGKHK